MVTENPLDCKSLASEAETMPLPNEEATPPVTKIYFVLRGEEVVEEVFFEVSLVVFLVVLIAIYKQMFFLMPQNYEKNVLTQLQIKFLYSTIVRVISDYHKIPDKIFINF